MSATPLRNIMQALFGVTARVQEVHSHSDDKVINKMCLLLPLIFMLR